MCCYQRSLRFDVRRGRENKNSCCYIQPHPIRRTSVIGAVMVTEHVLLMQRTS